MSRGAEARAALIEKLRVGLVDHDDRVPRQRGKEAIPPLDRPGGLGEHDLYCARFVAGKRAPRVALTATRDGGKGG